jgi:ribonuclease T2
MTGTARSWLAQLLGLILAAQAGSLGATVPIVGQLVAERDCPLYVSIRKGSNPDGARLVPGRAYPLIGKNREEATHYRVRADGASPAERWVEVGCGRPAAVRRPNGPETVSAGSGGDRGDSRGARPAGGTDPSAADEPAQHGRFVLAASWQPAFCELRSRRPECRDSVPAAGGGESAAFSLHGLWPQPPEKVFCGVPGRERDVADRGPWSRLPALDLRSDTRDRLEAVMPGTRSHLHRYQWVKHGTCYGTDEETYYRHSVALMTQLNTSAVRALFVANVGHHLSARDIRDAFDRAFGRGAGDRVRVRCSDGMIAELQIGLRGRVSESAALAPLIKAAQRRSAGCRGGRVDRPGLAD